MLGFAITGTEIVGAQVTFNIVAHPTASTPISAIFLRSPYFFTTKTSTIIGSVQRLRIPKSETHVVKTGFAGATTAKTILGLRKNSLTLMHRVPMRLRGPWRFLALNKTYGYIADAFMPLELDKMTANMEAAWLMRLYEVTVNKIREDSLPSKKVGVLEVETPTLKEQAYAIRERDNSYIF